MENCHALKIKRWTGSPRVDINIYFSFPLSFQGRGFFFPFGTRCLSLSFFSAERSWVGSRDLDGKFMVMKNTRSGRYLFILPKAAFRFSFSRIFK